MVYQVRRCCPELFARASVLLLLRLVELAVLFDDGCSCAVEHATTTALLASAVHLVQTD